MFIAIEGPEGSGKSTLVRGLVEAYQHRGLSVVFSREPGGTLIGEKFRRVLKDPAHQGKFPPLAEFFGFLAARAAFVEEVVRPALAEGKIVITDRYSLSTMAYQIAGRELPKKACLAAIRLAEGGVIPFYVVLLVSPEVGLQRKTKQGDANDRFAAEDLSFHRRVAAGYRYYGCLNNKRGHASIVLDTEPLSEAEVLNWVILFLDQYLS
jgi:dTMP kinase